MMKKLVSLLLLGMLPLGGIAQHAVELKQKNLSRWGIGTANYSGITALGGNRYALVSDKEPADGFYVFTIEQDETEGTVKAVVLDRFYGNPTPKVDASGMTVRDCEGIAYFPSSNTLFISGEGDQQILEYRMDGTPTGRKLRVPEIFSLKNIVPNMGFEALTYSAEQHRFWTVTETTLPKDGAAAGVAHPGEQNLLRLQCFGDDLLPAGEYAYRMDRGKKEDFGKIYVYGVPELTALPDGRLLVLEREVDISNGYMSSEVSCKLFLVNPGESWQIDSTTDLKKLDPNKYLVKQLVAVFKTQYTPFQRSFANYEGMCLGKKLKDGRQTLLMVNDSQAGYGKGPFHLNDYIKVLILP